MEIVKRTAAILPFEALQVGLSAELLWSVTDADIDAFAELSGDYNPLHVDAGFARAAGFPDRVVHGMLLGSKLSAFVGMIIPGRDCLLLETQLAWPNAVHPGDDVMVRGEITEKSEDQRVVRIKIKATKLDSGRRLVVGRGWALCQIRY